MTAKEYLSQYKKLEELLQATEADLEELKEAYDHIQVQMDGMPRGTEISNPTEALALKITMMTYQVMEERTALLAKKRDIRAVISQIKEWKQIRVINLKYIEGKSWNEIAKEMHYTRRTITRLHGYALLQVTKILGL